MSDKSSNPPSKNRSQWFACLIYPDSCPDWREILNGLQIPCAVSPLHEYDVKENGELKKPHYHCILNFSSLKSVSQVANLVESLSNGFAKVILSPKASYEYLTHKNNPEKAQYNESDIILLNGFKPPLGRAELQDMSVSKLVSIIRDNHFNNYSQLLFSVADDSAVVELVLKYSYALNLVINEQKGK